MKNYTTSPQGIVALLSHEGIVPAPYFDSVGVLTWGVGHTAAAGAPYPNKIARGMPTDIMGTVREAMTVFAADLKSYEAGVNRALKVDVAQHEFDALVSFHFNTGAVARAEVTRKLNAGDRAGAAKAFMNWRTPKEIIGRREDEQELFRDGTYPDGPINVWHANAAGKVVYRAAKRVTPEEAFRMMSLHWSDQFVPAVEETQDEGFEELDENDTPLLARGAKGESVRYAQTLLKAHGHKLNVDGDFGPTTDKLVRAFQKKKGLKADGWIGPKTWDELKKPR